MTTLERKTGLNPAAELFPNLTDQSVSQLDDLSESIQLNLGIRQELATSDGNLSPFQALHLYQLFVGEVSYEGVLMVKGEPRESNPVDTAVDSITGDLERQILSFISPSRQELPFAARTLISKIRIWSDFVILMKLGSLVGDANRGLIKLFNQSYGN